MLFLLEIRNYTINLCASKRAMSESLNLNVLKEKTGAPNAALVLWAQVSWSQLSFLRVTWHDVGCRKCCQWWISAKANGLNAWISGLQWENLCRFWKGKHVGAFYLFLFLSSFFFFFFCKRHIEVLSCGYLKKRMVKSTGPVSILRLICHHPWGLGEVCGLEWANLPEMTTLMLALSNLQCRQHQSGVYSERR